jgi:hypothetical protein
VVAQVSTGRKRKLARTFFLGVTVLAIGTECWFAWDGDANTDPWTDLIGDYVPWQLTMAVFGALVVWLPAHFYVRYKREAREHLETKVELISARRSIGLANGLIEQYKSSPADPNAQHLHISGEAFDQDDDSNNSHNQGTLF